MGNNVDTEVKRGMRFSIRNKILIGSLAVNILICLVMGIVIYFNVRTTFIKSSADDTLAMAQISARNMNGNLLSILEEGSDDSYANQVIRESMNEIVENADVNAIYTVGYRNGSLVYLSQPESEGALIGEPVEAEYIPEMEAAYNSTGYVINKIENDGGTNFITAYAPIQNNKGEVVGILGVDYVADRIVSSLNSIVILIVGIGLVLMVVSVVISIILATSITHGLHVVNTKVSDLVSNDGDLTQKIYVSSNDEVSDIADNINNLLAYIRSVVGSINNSSTELSHSVDMALKTTGRTNEQLESVAATMEEMSAAMEETSASLQQVQNSTQAIGDSVRGMYESVQNGTSYATQMKKRADEMVKDAKKETSSARDAADKMALSLNEKIEKSKAVEKISALTQTILDIASQTNLLSLNASIEAARAGEHGRGFAVVAGEISSLASNSADTAKQIQTISEEVIFNVNELVNESKRMVDFVREKTIAGYEQLQDTGVQYQKDAESISTMMDAIEGSSESIEASMQDVANAMNDVSTAVEESARGVSDVANAVTDMSANMAENNNVAGENAEIAKNLDQEVNKFKF